MAVRKKRAVVKSNVRRKRAKVENSYGSYFLRDKEIDFIPSGCTPLDCVMGGGYPGGRVVNIVGDKSTGKTLLAIEAAANFNRVHPDGIVFYDESEAAFDTEYAELLGLPTDHVEMLQSETVEDLFNSLNSILDKYPATHILYVTDSLDSLSDRTELETPIDKGTYGAAKPKTLSKLFRQLIRRIKKSNLTWIVISQIRDNIGVTFGRKHSRSGGRALDFYASIVLWLAEMGKVYKQVKGVKRPIGIEVKAKADKNKIGLPYRDCTFKVIFGYGIDEMDACLSYLKSVNVAAPKGADIDELKELVIETYREIETQFLPTTRKY